VLKGGLIDLGSSGLITGAFSSDTTLPTPVPINKGGTGQTTAQAAIDALTAVSGASTNEVLSKDGSGNAAWAAASGDANLTFIAEVTLGSANAVIEKNSGLDSYECVVVDFVLRESGGDTFIPVFTWYEDGAEITANYGFSETIDGAAISKTNASTEIPIDGNTTANNNVAGRLIIYPHTAAANVIDCSYAILTSSSSSAPDAVGEVRAQHDGGSDRVSGIKFEQTGGGTPTFSDESHLEIWGIKAI
jgi:hypothetical protein